MPIINLLFWLVLLGAAWIGYQLLSSYNQAEADALREIAVCRGMDRHQRAAQFDIRIGGRTFGEPVRSQYKTSFLTVGDNMNINMAPAIEFQLPAAVENHKEMAADTDCQTCA